MKCKAVLAVRSSSRATDNTDCRHGREPFVTLRSMEGFDEALGRAGDP